ncbi:MAG TPA: phosphatidate cytidylyltransferase [Thermodesulfobacteriota bacterium]|nr:phosphatidate cytidylyltransferase [Thermodesulfobacteriota bacterium]
MHLKRWISGLILAPCLILFILFAPRWLFLPFFMTLVFIGLGEYYALALPMLSAKARWAGIFLGLLLLVSLYSRDPRCFLFALVFLLLFLLIWAIFQAEDFPLRVEKAGKHLLGFLYIPFLLSHFVLMVNLDLGRLLILFTLVAVYFGDTTAFYIGRTWGRKKLAPKISPGKTVEGGWGAVGGSILGALISKYLFLPQLAPMHVFILGGAIGVAGQLGDLWESLLKRSAEVKDSGTLIPGHGGLLDRIDSVLFSAPLVYYYALGVGL